MEGYSESENSKEGRSWTTDMMRENREKWNLAADVGVLEYLQQFGNKLLNETEKTVNLLDSFEAELNTSCVQVSNITNRFLSLADSQFVENRVYDDEETPTPDTTNKVPSDPVKTKQELEIEMFNRLKESVNNGLNVLNTKFEAVEVSNSDSEDDDSGPMGTVYKPINVFNNRPLPHLIGSVDFFKDPTVGLEELVSDEEESIEEESSSESKELSEGNEDSEAESDHLNIILPKDDIHNNDTNDILFAQTSSSFADHLAKRLESMENESRLPKQQTRNLFSTTPPPLDDSCDDEFGSTEDLIFGSNGRNDLRGSDDRFAPKLKSGFKDNEDLFVPKSNTSLWDNDNSDSFKEKVEPSNQNDARKKVMKDLENRLSQNFKSNIGDNFYDISPSPPPLSDDLNNENANGDEKFKNKTSSLFDDNLVDNDETDELFVSSTKNISSANKKKIFPGSVDVFGNTADLFKDSVKHQSKNNGSKSVTNDEGNIIDNDIISKTILSIRKNYEDENDEEDEDSIFKSSNQQEKSSSRSSSVKLSESFQDDNISIKSNKSAGLFDEVLTNSKKNSIKKTMDDLFCDLNNCADEDDDLFSSDFSSKDNTKNKNIFSGSNNSGSLSSVVNNSSSINKSNKTGIVDDLFADIDVEDDLFSSLVNKKSSESKDDKLRSDAISAKTSSKPLSLFDNEDDTDIFGSDFLSTREISNSKNVESSQTTLPKVKDDKDKTVSSSSVGGTPINKLTKKGSGLFDDDDIDLFGEAASSSSGDIFSSDIFSKKPNSVPRTLTNENKKLVTETVTESDNLFSNIEEPSNISMKPNYDKNLNEGSATNTTRTSDLLHNENKNILPNENINPPEVSLSNRNIKTANVRSISLFGSDTNDDFADDDLFSTNNKVPSKNFPNVVDDEIQKEEKNRQTSILSSSDQISIKNIPSDVIESENLFKGPDSSNDKLLIETDNSRTTLPVNNTPPLLDIEDDSPLFSDDKNNSVAFSTKDCNDGIFGKAVNGSDIKQTDSNHLFSEKTDKSILFSSPDELSSENLFHTVNDPNIEGKHDSSVSKNVTDFNSSKNIFNTNQSLPSVPVKKPDIPIKPSKPEPPKSLNIRAPISSPDPFGTNVVKETSAKTSSDNVDGNALSSEVSSTLLSPRITPGKINLDKSLNINPKALLPGARPTSFKKSSSPPAAKENQTSKSPKEYFNSDLTGGNASKLNSDLRNDDIISGSSSSLPNTDSEPVLQSIAKDRAKIQVKRRPQTRKARREAIRQSTIENNNEDDETDNSSSITTQSNKEPQSTSSSIFDQPSNILSPSTDEEDLFGVPPLDLPPDYSKVTISPGDIFDAPTIISSNLSTTRISNDKLENDTSTNETIDELNISHKNNDRDSFLNDNLGVDSAKLFNDTASDKENSDIFNEIIDDSKNAGRHVKNKSKNSIETDNLFSDIDDSDIFSKNSNKLKQNMDDNDSDLFFTKSEKLKGPSDNVNSPIINNDLLQKKSDKSEVNLEHIVNNSDISLTKSKNMKENVNAVVNNDLDLFSSRSKESSNNITISNDLKKGDSSNIICGVFNTGVVNICDKLSITPPNNDELFPPSDWTLSNKTDNTVVSVPEKIKPESLFTDDIGSNNIDEDDGLFTISNSSSSNVKENLNTRKANDSKNKTKLVSDLFASDDDEDDNNLFGKVKTNTLVHSKPSASISQKMDLSTSETKKSSLKTQSLFGDDDDEDDGDIFGLPDKSKSLSNTKNRNLSNDLLKNTSNSSSGAMKKSSGVAKPKKLTPAATKQESFTDPLAALGNKDQ